MPPWQRVLLLVVLVLCATLSGCLSFGIGDVRYEPGALHVRASNGGAPRDAAIQVTAFRVQDLSQDEVATGTLAITLAGGEHEYTVPLDLPPGKYKLYVYLIMDNDRKAGVIRDITV
jgi:hypothetical protein